MNTCQTKQIEIHAGKEIFTFAYRYLKSKDSRILNACLKRAKWAGPIHSVYIVEAERTPGYLNQSYPIADSHYEESLRKKVSLDWLKKQFEK